MRIQKSKLPDLILQDQFTLSNSNWRLTILLLLENHVESKISKLTTAQTERPSTWEVWRSYVRSVAALDHKLTTDLDLDSYCHDRIRLERLRVGANDKSKWDKICEQLSSELEIDHFQLVIVGEFAPNSLRQTVRFLTNKHFQITGV